MPEENWLDIKGKKFFYKKEGKGKPVLLIHGFAEDGNIWHHQTNVLKNYFQLLIPDLIGSGKSFLYQPMNNTPMTIEDHAETIKLILDKEKISTCTMIGHSMGGYIALAFAEKYPEKMDAFILFHSTAYADNEEKKATRRKSIDFIKKHGAAEFIKQSSPNLFSEHTKKNHPELIEELIKMYDNFNADVLVSYYEAMMLRSDRTNVLRNFNKPVMLIIGENDNTVPLQHSLEQSHIPDLCYIHILKNTSHMGMWESAGEANNFLTAFIKNAVA